MTCWPTVRAKCPACGAKSVRFYVRHLARFGYTPEWLKGWWIDLHTSVAHGSAER